MTIKHVIPKHLESISAKLIEMGAEIEELDDAVRVVATKRLSPTTVKTMPYPGFPTDRLRYVFLLLTAQALLQRRFSRTDLSIQTS